MPVVSRPSTRGDKAVRSDGRVAGRVWPPGVRPTVRNRLRQPANESPATQTSQPRQPIRAPMAAASGTPTTRVRDWPLMTQPRARPR